MNAIPAAVGHIGEAHFRNRDRRAVFGRINVGRLRVRGCFSKILGAEVDARGDNGDGENTDDAKSALGHEHAIGVIGKPTPVPRWQRHTGQACYLRRRFVGYTTMASAAAFAAGFFARYSAVDFAWASSSGL